MRDDAFYLIRCVCVRERCNEEIIFILFYKKIMELDVFYFFNL